MIACLWGLWGSKPRSGGRAHELYKILWKDGLVYFVCASVANAFPGELSFKHSSIYSLVGFSHFYGPPFEPYVHDNSTVDTPNLSLHFSRDGHRFDDRLRVRYDNGVVSCCAAAQYMGHKQPSVSEIVILWCLSIRNPFRTQNSAYKMSTPNRSARDDTRKPTSLKASDIEHGRKSWSKRKHFPTEGDVHLSS